MRIAVHLLALSGALCLAPFALATDPVGAAECAVCHQEVVDALALTPHAASHGWDADAACESCHGPGQAHIESGGEASLILRPQEQSREESSRNCLSCHRDQRSHFNAARSLHRLSDVGCLDCHSPHATNTNMLAREGADQCGSCHQNIVAQFDLPRAHPLGNRGEECTSCHDPHGARTLRTSLTARNATCNQCHFEKAGPFVFAHDVTMVDGCNACHTVHGSSNRHLLTHETQVNLCYQCHAASSTPVWHSTPRFLNEKCTACHSAIHGSNTSRFFLEE